MANGVESTTTTGKPEHLQPGPIRHGSNTIFNTNGRQAFCDWRFSLWTSASEARKIQGLNTTWYTEMGFGRKGKVAAAERKEWG
jgi:hypothetical protein